MYLIRLCNVVSVHSILTYNLLIYPNSAAHLNMSFLIEPAKPPPRPGLREATQKSMAAWQRDLELLFQHAKDRFADVVWELAGDKNESLEEVWGHKGMPTVLSPTFRG